MSRILGIDFGTKRIGLALSDESAKFAFPHSVIPNLSTSDVDRLGKRVCEENNVEKIVLGKPEGYKGDATRILKKIEKFKTKLEKEVGLEVIYENEVLTTKQAERPLNPKQNRGDISNKKKLVKKQGKNTDASAAALILQSYLDRLNQ